MQLKARLTLLFVSLVLAATAGVGLIAAIGIERYFEGRLVAGLLVQSRHLESLLRGLVAPAYGELAGLAHTLGVRLTLLKSDGRVVFDSEVAADRLPFVENHADRPEVRSALLGAHGTHMRRSATVDVELLYVARRLDRPIERYDAEIIRLSVPLSELRANSRAIRAKVLVGCVVALLAAGAAGLLVSRRIARPIEHLADVAEEVRRGNFDRPIAVTSDDEIGRLSRVLSDVLGKLKDDISRMSKLEKVRSEFLGNVSHELRTPIFAIQGFIETLLGGAIDDPRVNREFLNKALDNTSRLSALLTDLIDISRIESGEMKLSLRVVDLRELLGSVCHEMQPKAAQRGIALELVPVDEEAAEVHGDEQRIRQVMTNLVDNAIKYTDAGSVTVSAVVSDGGVRIDVADTGCGIAPEHQPRIFERFYRVDKDRSREAGGTGLGLAIVKHIVEAHGSAIELESTPGRGSRFSFTLRRANPRS